jgi:uncharacterized protein YgiM (DUF1202 family)
VAGFIEGVMNLRLERTKSEFDIVVRATEGQAKEEAIQNLLFFVDIGFLSDPDGKIADNAKEGIVPRISASASLSATAGVNVRAGPGTNFPIIEIVPPGQSFEVLSVADDWLQIKLADEREGYINQNFVTFGGN